MKFLIYGAGALGQALGCLLKSTGHDVDFILRQRFIPSLLQYGLQVTGIFGSYSVSLHPSHLFEETSRVSNRSYDYVLLTTKAYDTSKAIKELVQISNQFKHIVSMQNGCGNVEQLEAFFGSEKALGARVITGFEITSPGQVEITVSADAIHVGSCIHGVIPQAAEKLAEIITAAGHPCLAVEDIYRSLFTKLLYNCTLNPLGAVLGVHYGKLAERQETRQIMTRIIEETYAVILALGGKTDWPDAESYKQAFFEKLIPATSNHRPSMLQDLENHKPTEIDALTGYVSLQGRRHNIPTPTCDLLSCLVKFKECSFSA